MANEVDPKARKFGAEVRRFREQAGLSQSRLASLLPASQATVSDIELGKTPAKKDTAERIDQVLNSGGRLIAVWEEQHEAYQPPDWYRKLPIVEQRATQIQQYQPLLVPGLLQTRGYAGASIRASNRPVPQAAVDAKVAERTERQTILRREDPPFLSVVLDETALHRRLGSPDIMREQLGHLLEVSVWNRVEVLVIPADTWDHPGLDSGFTLLRVPDAGMLLYLETKSSGGVITDAGTVDEHISRLGDLRGLAFPPDQSRSLIKKVLGEIE
ncbi:helix-turn-helix transcriptional regulator [Nocardiopsis dassonvillei]|uniref:helix-turn-helix domain-containing protein n=1 Tax=Nocardiopsis dassonvillei TaxID=2014 RepID=UPI00102CDABA|nr:helix-turn-helix transcriptional regulator [Nocardiopsis dassonvillei]MCP3015495.1 helix-turn-helix transcriptional regulator [Nocardiopsis dassonvillei]